SLAGFGALALLLAAGGFAVAQANRAGVLAPVPPPAAGQGGLLQTGADWPAWGGGADAQRYSPLDQINRDNVARLERVWTYRTGDLPETRWGAETTPLKVGDTLYLCTARNILIALDARTG